MFLETKRLIIRSIQTSDEKAFIEMASDGSLAEICFVYFDMPLTLEHERELLQNAGFEIENVFDNSDGATIIADGKED